MTIKTLLPHPLVAAIFAATGALATSTIAAPVDWTGAVSSDWMEAGNWSSGLVPTNDVSVQIRNGDTVTLNDDGSANSLHLYVGYDGGDGHLISSGSPLKTDGITIGQNESVAGDINASLTVTDADINATNGIYLVNSLQAGDKNVSFSHTGGIINTSKIKHSADLATDETSSIVSQFTLQDVIVNTSSNENILGGDVAVNWDATNAHGTVDTIINLSDVTWISNPKLDLEIGSDMRTLGGVTNSSLAANAKMTVERSQINAAWLEFAEYTGTRHESSGNTVTNKVDASFIDSSIYLDYRMILGDVGADGSSDNRVSGEVNVALINTDLDVRFDIQLTDIGVQEGARGEDRAYLTAMDSDIHIGRLLEIASYGYVDGTGTAILDAGVTLDNSQLTVDGIIQVADIASEVKGGSIVPGPSDSYTGSLVANSSVIAAQELAAGSVASSATLQLDNTYLSLSDVLDPEDQSDIDTLEAKEGALRLTDGSLLVMQVDGLTRADEFNAKGGTELYSAIDAVQASLDGKLQINVSDAIDEESSVDLIRVVKDDELTLGEDAFTGIKGDFDEVTFIGLADGMEATSEIVEETIDGTTYDIYRVNFAGSFSATLLGFMLLLVGYRRIYQK